MSEQKNQRKLNSSGEIYNFSDDEEVTTPLNEVNTNRQAVNEFSGKKPRA